MTNADLSLQGMSVEEVYARITKTGVSKAEAATLVGAWIYHNVGRAKRTFAYVTPFASDAPACKPTFARSLQHADWVDGESVVQAEETVSEEGFNRRFHHIEDDLDALAADQVKQFACLTELRHELRALLDEIRAELNRLNADVYEALGTARTPGAPQTIGPIRPDLQFEYVDTMKFLDKYVQVFNTSQGLVMVPAIKEINVFPGADARIQRTAKMARFIEENPEVRKRFPRNVKKEELVRAFGRESAVDGTLVRDLVGILPEANYESLDTLMGDLAQREAAALRTSDSGITAITNAFGLDVDVKTVGDAPIDRFATIPVAARTALLSGGIQTMKDLAGASPKQVTEIVTGQGVATSLGDAAEWTFGAKALTFTR
ncbi:hypothetical protein [Nonomuraea sp. NPDC003201]